MSVIVPVYNPGGYLDACIGSLLGQSLAPDAYEVIFVDDGSTDGSAGRLDRLAAEAPNVRVIHIPNSGWPGRPRNVGLDASAGEYVLFCDHDDWLGNEALERLTAMAELAGADIVLGREVGHGRGVPRELFRRNVDSATLQDAPLLRLMTPHKLFRRSMLATRAIRFPEGRRRFEDHVFVLRAYFAARRISILADYPCYHWVTREGHGNASDQYAAPRSYYADLRDVLDVVDANLPPGEARDRLTAHWYRRRCLDRLRGERWTDAPTAHDREIFDEVRRLAGERIGPGVVASLPLSHRVRSAAVTADRPDLVTALARVEHGLRARVRVRSVGLDGRLLRLELSADVFDASSAPMRFGRTADARVTWQPPAAIPPGAFSPAQLDATHDLEATTVSVVFRLDDRALEHDAPAVIQRVLRNMPDGSVLMIRAHAEIDLRHVAAGGPLPEGRWELLADVESCGWRSLRRLPAITLPPAEGHARLVAAPDGALELHVGDVPAASPRTTPQAPQRRRAGHHRIERLVPRSLLRMTPVRLRQAGKRLVLRLTRR